MAANPPRTAIAVLSSVSVDGSGTALRLGAVICPLPEKEIGVTWFGPGGPEGRLATPAAVANPVAPLKMPVPLRIANVLEDVGNPIALSAPNTAVSAPGNVSVPPLNEAVKVFITEDGTNAPDGNIINVIVPASE